MSTIGMGALLALIVCTGCTVKNVIYPVPPVKVGAPPPSFDEVELELDQATRVVCWHRPGDPRSDDPALIFFHGNGENLETLKWAGLYGQLAALDGPVLVVDYPGYGRSTGQPAEKSLKLAAEGALLWMADRYEERLLVPAGWSLGAALAIHLAATHPEQVAGGIAISPWTSLHDVATAHFPHWLVAVGLRENYDSLGAAKGIRSPMLVIHGTADRIIPASHGERLAGALSVARWVPVEGAGHNDVLGFPRVWREITDFVSDLRSQENV